MTVRRLPDARLESALVRTREAAEGLPVDMRERVVHILDRATSSRRGWRFTMVEPVLFARMMRELAETSDRPQQAMVLFASLFQFLPDDSNELTISRLELAEATQVPPQHVSTIMGDLERIGAIYRRRAGRGVRYFVNPNLGTHLAGAVRDKAQAEAPVSLRLVQGGIGAP